MSQSDPRKEEAKKSFLSGATIASIAQQLGVSRRTIERWADDGAWREQQKVVPIGAKKTKSGIPDSPSNYEPRPRRQKQQEIDESEIVDLAIADISSAMGIASSEDFRSLGSLAGGLVRLLEYRRKICPPTVAALAEQAIELGCTPDTFWKALDESWRQRA